MRRLLVLAPAILLAACADDTATDGAPDLSVADGSVADGSVGDGADPIDLGADFALAPGVERTYAAHDGVVGGPERGFYRFTELTDTTDLSWVGAGGHTLVFSYVRLDAYRESAIGADLLTALEAGLDAARAEGLKVILRFAYNEGPWPDSEPDASLDWVLAHIDQLAPLFARHEDVIALVQAGFVGAWGEWHTSTNGLLDDPADRRTILEALLAALPASRSTQIRYPLYKEEMVGDPLTRADAHDGSFAARVGHHNDCFVSSDTDVGTYPSDQVDRLREYVAADTTWVPFGGETCAPYPARSACAPAMAELAMMHASYLNEDYHPEIIAGWRTEGCYDTIARSMGYRLWVERATFPEAARPGGVFALDLAIRNDGWAAPFNPRHPVLVLEGGGARYEAALSDDVRFWLGGEAHSVIARVQLPADAAPGAYTLGLRLPDEAATLADRPEYALPFANAEGFDAATGTLALGTLTLADDAPGDTVPGASFEAL